MSLPLQSVEPLMEPWFWNIHWSRALFLRQAVPEKIQKKPWWVSFLGGPYSLSMMLSESNPKWDYLEVSLIFIIFDFYTASSLKARLRVVHNHLKYISKLTNKLKYNKSICDHIFFLIDGNKILTKLPPLHTEKSLGIPTWWIPSLSSTKCLLEHLCLAWPMES